MKIVNVIDEDFSNYKKVSMFIGFPKCTFKCDIECGKPVCQNSSLAKARSIDVEASTIVDRYMDNNLTSAVVIGGLEPLDSFNDLMILIRKFREQTLDDIVIFTGYTEDEITNKIPYLKMYKNIIIKFGRFIPDQQHHIDPVLNVELASDNQYAKRIS